MHEEVAGLLQQLQGEVVTQRIGRRDYHRGRLQDQSCVFVLARIGKVAAAATTVTLIREFNVDAVVFVGVAGAVAPEVRVGDMVVAHSLLQHDLDASPIFPRHEIPLLGCSRIQADAGLSARLLQGAQDFLAQDFDQQVAPATRAAFGLSAPRVHQGTIISGDCFVNDAAGVHALRDAVPDALCVEMEGAAVAQICHEYGVPFAVLRSISDRADGSADLDFNAFLHQVAQQYSAGVLLRFLGSGE